MVFNQRYRRIGPVYQSRYSSVLIEKGKVFKEMIRFVHLDTVRHGFTSSLDELARDRWTGHASLMGQHNDHFDTVDEVLRLFSSSKPGARLALRRWMNDGLTGRDSVGTLFDLSENGPRGRNLTHRGPFFLEPYRGDSSVMGTVRFVENALKRLSVQRARVFRLWADGWDIDALITWVCQHTGADAAALRRGRRTAEVSQARALVAYLAVNALDCSNTDVAISLGVSAPAISQALGRGQQLAESNGMKLNPGMSPPIVAQSVSA